MRSHFLLTQQENLAYTGLSPPSLDNALIWPMIQMVVNLEHLDKVVSSPDPAPSRGKGLAHLADSTVQTTNQIAGM